MKIITVLIFLLILSGCATNPPKKSIYTEQMEEVELAFKDKKITYAEYLNLKNNIEDARQQRKVTVLASYIKPKY